MTLRRVTGYIVFLTMLASSAIAGEKQQSSFSISTPLTDGWLLKYVPATVPSSSILIDGKPHILFDGSASLNPQADHTGEPLLPVDVVTLGIPQGAALTARLIEPSYELIENQLVAPYPAYTFEDQSEATAEYNKSSAAYAQNRFFPSEEFAVGVPVIFRDQNIASVRISPYHYNPATKVLRRLVSAKIQITLLGSVMSTAPKGPSRPDTFFEEMYRNTLLNYEEAKGWRLTSGAFRPLESGPDPTRDWFETGKNYYKIPIAEDGWYKVTKMQLIAAGATGSLIDIPTLKIFYRGAQIPILVRPDTSVEFYGQRNAGDSTYTDFFTDTSAYWLTWGGPTGLRFVPSFTDSAGQWRIL